MSKVFGKLDKVQNNKRSGLKAVPAAIFNFKKELRMLQASNN